MTLVIRRRLSPLKWDFFYPLFTPFFLLQLKPTYNWFKIDIYQQLWGMKQWNSSYAIL